MTTKELAGNKYFQMYLCKLAKNGKSNYDKPLFYKKFKIWVYVYYNCVYTDIAEEKYSKADADFYEFDINIKRTEYVGGDFQHYKIPTKYKRLSKV